MSYSSSTRALRWPGTGASTGHGPGRVAGLAAQGAQFCVQRHQRLATMCWRSTAVMRSTVPFGNAAQVDGARGMAARALGPVQLQPGRGGLQGCRLLARALRWLDGTPGLRRRAKSAARWHHMSATHHELRRRATVHLLHRGGSLAAWHCRADQRVPMVGRGGVAWPPPPPAEEAARMNRACLGQGACRAGAPRWGRRPCLHRRRVDAGFHNLRRSAPVKSVNHACTAAAGAGEVMDALPHRRFQ